MSRIFGIAFEFNHYLAVHDGSLSQEESIINLSPCVEKSDNIVN